MKINGDISHDEICELVRNNGLTASKFLKALMKFEIKNAQSENDARIAKINHNRKK